MGFWASVEKIFNEQKPLINLPSLFVACLPAVFLTVFIFSHLFLNFLEENLQTLVKSSQKRMKLNFQTYLPVTILFLKMRILSRKSEYYYQHLVAEDMVEVPLVLKIVCNISKLNANSHKKSTQVQMLKYF